MNSNPYEAEEVHDANEHSSGFVKPFLIAFIVLFTAATIVGVSSGNSQTLTQTRSYRTYGIPGWFTIETQNGVKNWSIDPIGLCQALAFAALCSAIFLAFRPMGRGRPHRPSKKS